MYCRHCGNLLSDDSRFCSKCGQPIETIKTEEPVAEAPEIEQAYTIGQPDPAIEQKTAEEKTSLASSVLTWGILSLAFAISGCIGLLGFIFSFIAKNKAAKYIAAYGEPEARVSIGKGLAKAGFIVGLIMMIFWTLYFSIWFFVLMMVAMFA